MNLNKLEPGDLLFVYDPRWWNFVSTAVKITSTDVINSKYRVSYHVAVVIDKYNIIESTWGKGVREVPIDHYERKSFHTWGMRCKLDDSQKIAIIKWLMSQIGRSYDKWQILSIFTRSFLRIIPPLYKLLKKKTSFLDSRHKFICSELVKRAYLSIGIDLYPRASTSEITPWDLQRSDILKMV